MTYKHFDIAARYARHNTLATKAREVLQQHWNNDFNKFHDARKLIYCAIISVHYRYATQNETLKSDKVQLTLTINSFFKGIKLTELAICEGLYAQAYNLLKQEMETLSACIEIRKGKRKDKKTPNTQHLPYGLKSAYGHLNNVAHVSHLESLKRVNLKFGEGNSSSASANPQYNERIAKSLYGLHITLMHELALEMIQGFAPKVKAGEIKEELEVLMKAFKLLQDLDILA